MLSFTGRGLFKQGDAGVLSLCLDGVGLRVVNSDFGHKLTVEGSDDELSVSFVSKLLIISHSWFDSAGGNLASTSSLIAENDDLSLVL